MSLEATITKIEVKLAKLDTTIEERQTAHDVRSDDLRRWLEHQFNDLGSKIILIQDNISKMPCSAHKEQIKSAFNLIEGNEDDSKGRLRVLWAAVAVVVTAITGLYGWFIVHLQTLTKVT